MPKIRPYEQQVSATTNIPDVRAVGGAVAAGGVYEAGRAIVHAGEKLYDIAQRQEIGDVHAKLAKARADWTLALQERANSTAPGDPNFAQKFATDFSEYVQTLDGQFKTVAGQAAYRRGVADLSSHFTESAGRYQAAAMGAKAKQDYLSSLDSFRNALLSDPKSLPGVLKQAETALMDPNGPYARMPVREREMLARQTKTEMALSAVQGELRINPTATLAALTGGKWDSLLDADKKAALLQQAEVAIRSEEAKREAAAARSERAQRREQMVVMDGIVKAMIDNEATPEQIRDANLPPATKLQLVGMLRRQELQGEKIVDDPQVVIATWQKITSGQLRDENELNALFGQGLRLSTIDRFRAEMQGRRTEAGQIESALKDQFLDSVKRDLSGTNPMIGKRDPKGDEQYTRFLAWFLPEFAKQKANGKTATELLSPDSPEYMGRYAARLRRSPAEMLRDMFQYGDAGAGLGAAAGAPGSTLTAPTAGDIESRAKRKASVGTGANKRTIYEVDGLWYEADGSVHGVKK